MLADADCKPVPSVHKTNVDGLKAPGAIAYPAIDVRTTRPVSMNNHIYTTLSVFWTEKKGIFQGRRKKKKSQFFLLFAVQNSGGSSGLFS